MSKVIFDTAISLDGFMAGDNRGPQNPLGDRGTTLHTWMYAQKKFLSMLGAPGGEVGRDNDLLEEVFGRTGSYIMGKRMFEEGEANWPEDLYKADVYVLTHEKRDPWIQKGSTVFYFINDGIESALQKARESAKGKDVRLQGGGQMIQHYLNAGLVDEFFVHITPVVLGSGIRLFNQLNRDKFNIEIVEVIPSQATTHIRYKVINK